MRIGVEAGAQYVSRIGRAVQAVLGLAFARGKLGPMGPSSTRIEASVEASFTVRTGTLCKVSVDPAGYVAAAHDPMLYGMKELSMQDRPLELFHDNILCIHEWTAHAEWCEACPRTRARAHGPRRFIVGTACRCTLARRGSTAAVRRMP